VAPLKGPVSGLIPSADLYITTHLQEEALARSVIKDLEHPAIQPLIKFLQQEQRGETWMLSTSTTRLAAPIIIATGQAVQARGGFHGLDRAITPEQLAAQVKSGQVRFAMLGDVAQVSRRLGADAAGKEISDWIRQHGRPVDPALWKAPGSREAWELFDLGKAGERQLQAP
jgi:4-amino-4-deoxy-L-arabinose transferase-like glycosyltransferase